MSTIGNENFIIENLSMMLGAGLSVPASFESILKGLKNKELIKNRGHLFDNVPIIIENKFEDLSKTKDILLVMKNIGLNMELERLKTRKVRPGKGKNRGRKYRIKKGPLIVLSNKCKLEKAASNLQGIDIINIKNLNAELLAPGTNAGRLVIWTQNSIERLAKENLFL